MVGMMKTKNRKQPDWYLLGAAAGLSVIGLLVQLSAGGYQGELPRWLYHAGFLLLGLGLVVAARLVDHRRLRIAAPWFFALSAGLLVLVLLLPGEGAKRWLSLGFANLQPSEPVKLAFIVLTARLLADDTPGRRHYLLLFALTLLVMLLVALEPDLGTAFVFVPILLGMLYRSGTPWWKILLLLLPFAIGLLALTEPSGWLVRLFGGELASSPLGALMRPWWWAGLAGLIALWLLLRKREKRYAGGLLAAGLTTSALLPLAWGMLLDYQQRRILMFLDPTADPKGAGYNLIQSKIAIGSGGIWGKGLARGSQSQLAFLPERHTDFAFSVWAEEWGLVGSLVLLALFGVLIWRLLRVARMVENRFSSLIAYGVAAMIGFHAVFNIGMCLGLFPVAGLPLPFVSYGGSFMLTCWLAVGLVEGLRAGRDS